jgi:hypothetical protein
MSMTSVAQSDQLVLRVVACVTSKFLVMNLQSLHVAARLTAPVVSLGCETISHSCATEDRAGPFLNAPVALAFGRRPPDTRNH